MEVEAKTAGWKTALTIVLLVVLYPVGVILMFVWMKWSGWVKILVTIAGLVFFVVGVLSILAAIVLVAINPARQFSTANNTKRTADVNSILNAVYQYAADNRGQLPVEVSGNVQKIASGGADICALLVPNYLSALPEDPLINSADLKNNGDPVVNCAGAYDIGYTIVRSPVGNRITVAAPAAELGQVISVTR